MPCRPLFNVWTCQGIWYCYQCCDWLNGFQVTVLSPSVPWRTRSHEIPTSCCSTKLQCRHHRTQNKFAVIWGQGKDGSQTDKRCAFRLGTPGDWEVTDGQKQNTLLDRETLYQLFAWAGLWPYAFLAPVMQCFHAQHKVAKISRCWCDPLFREICPLGFKFFYSCTSLEIECLVFHFLYLCTLECLVCEFFYSCT